MQLDELSIQGLLEDLPNWSVGRRLLIVAGIWLVFMACCFFLFWKPAMDESAGLERQIESSLARLNSQSQLLLEAPAIQTELAQLEALLPVLKMALPTERELAALLGRINDLILENELKLAEFTPQAPVEQEVMRVVPVKVSMRGQGESIARLPNYIAGLSRQVSIKTFEMSVLPDFGGWQMNGELNAFAQLPEGHVPQKAVVDGDTGGDSGGEQP